MKTIFCTVKQETDLNKIIVGQAEKLCSDYSVIKVDAENNQETLVDALADIEDEYVLFVPINNMLVEQPDVKALNKLVEVARKHELDYIVLRRIGIHKAKEFDKELNLWESTSNLFFLVPHIFKTEALKGIVSRVKTANMLYWLSLETTGYTGAYYFNPKDQPDGRLSYWRSGVFHTLSEVFTPLGQWHENYIKHNNQYLKKLLSEYNIDVETRGVGSIGGRCS